MTQKRIFLGRDNDWPEGRYILVDEKEIEEFAGTTVDVSEVFFQPPQTPPTINHKAYMMATAMSGPAVLQFSVSGETNDVIDAMEKRLSEFFGAENFTAYHTTKRAGGCFAKGEIQP